MKRSVFEASAAVVDMALIAAGNLAAALILARVMTPEHFGGYALAFTAILFISMIPMALVHSPMLVTLPHLLPQNEKPYASTLWTIQMGIVAVVGGIAAALLPLWWVASNEQIGVGESFAFLVWAIGFLLLEYRRYALLARASFGKLLAVDFFGLLVRLGYLTLWVNAETSASDVMIGFGLIQLGQLLICAGTGRGAFDRPTMGWEAAVAWRHWGYGKWILSEGLLYFASNQLYLFLVAALLGAKEVAALFAVQTIFNATNFVLNGMSNFAVPQASRRFRDRGLHGMIRFVGVVSIPFMALVSGYYALLATFGDTLVSLLYGEKYEAYSYLIPLFAITYFLDFLTRPILIAFRSGEMPHMGLWLKCASAAVTLVFAYPLVHSYGIVGAVVGQGLTCATWVIVGSFSLYFWARRDVSAVVVTNQ